MKLWNAVLRANEAGDFVLACGLLVTVVLALALAKRLAVRLLSATGRADPARVLLRPTWPC